MTRWFWVAATCGVLALGGRVEAQNGDRQGEEQPELPKGLVVPSAPALSAEEEARTFRVGEGMVVELVASEPLVSDPVVCVFDPDGSLWVVEMRGYMPDVDGKGEREPNGCVVRLRDTDGDGRMDRREVFLEGLVLPRAIALTRGGVLVISPPRMLFARDEDGDGKADVVQVVDQGLGGIESPEWAINALLPMLENGWYCANVPWRYVRKGETWARERVSAAGQWGATKDDQGRVYTNNNSDPLRVDLVSGVYAARNGNLGSVGGGNVRVVDDMSPRPARMNVGVNRGYQKGLLNGDWKLATVTGACAPWVVRGSGVLRGDALVCEPTGNLVLRYRLREDGAGGVKGEPVRNADGLDWLTSTDERFRPVGLCDGPDGAVYVCDMYRGLIQHRLFVTSFLRKQVVARGLEKPVGMGRVWRVRAKGERAKTVKLDGAGVEELVKALGSEVGWVRDTAQRLLVEEWEDSALAHRLLREAAKKGAKLERVHALWALAGMGGVTEEVALGALGAEDRDVRLAGVRVSERLAAEGGRVLETWLAVAKRGDASEVRQVVLSLGNVPTTQGLEALLGVVKSNVEVAEVRSAAVSGLGGRELDALRSIARREEWRAESVGNVELAVLLAKCVAREGRGDRLEGLIWLCAEVGGRKWLGDAIARGVLEARPKDGLGKQTWIRLAKQPAVMPEGLASAFAWPGKAGVEELKVRDLSAAEEKQFENGRALYEATCVQCHLGSGLGQTGQAPPLRGSKWALGDEERVVKILIGGLRGEIEIDGERWDGEMPSVGFGDDDLAALLTYVRREWGHGAEPITGATVARVRAAMKGRREAWTVKELESEGK